VRRPCYFSPPLTSQSGAALIRADVDAQLAAQRKKEKEAKKHQKAVEVRSFPRHFSFFPVDNLRASKKHRC
jgi:hypothetical protein